MKIHTKKKQYRQWCREQARSGKIVNEAGQWIARASAKESSMRRDFSPQEGK